MVLVGENAHCTYDLTGEGIGKALTSGILAADTLRIHGCSSQGLAHYNTAFTRTTLAMYEGYARAARMLKNPISNRAITTLLRHSSNARDALAAIIREESVPGDLFSVKGMLKRLQGSTV